MTGPCQKRVDSARHTAIPSLALRVSEKKNLTTDIATFCTFVLVAGNVDIRDMYIGANAAGILDSVYVPDKNGTRFYVVFVELVQRGTPNVHKRAYLDRLLPTWPTNEL